MRYAGDLQIVDGRCGRRPCGQSSGEIVVRAPGLTQGYRIILKPVRRSGAVLSAHAGYGVIDKNGYLRITDRLKDVIKVAGEWVSSLEVENALALVSGVKEVAVIGVPDKRWGERPLALLVVDKSLFNESAAQEQVRLLIARGSISKHALLTQFKLVDVIAKTRWARSIRRPCVLSIFLQVKRLW